ncbi:MAG TPA: hypothetical protein VG028_01895 [Terriglobia bacterium]|nr:hypothetical protein [Terriglobia bacterium]
MTRTIFPLGLTTLVTNLGSQVRGGEAAWGTGQSQERLRHPAHAKLVEINSSHPRLPYPRGQGQLLQLVVGDKADIQTLKSVEEALDHTPQESRDGRKMGAGIGYRVTPVLTVWVTCPVKDAMQRKKYRILSLRKVESLLAVAQRVWKGC